MKPDKALLVLEDGVVFEGTPFGAPGRTLGEAVFYTGVVGYQEILTDPSYAGTIAVLTYPIIGSYGVNGEDNESPGVHVAGVVVKQYSRHVSNFRATGALEEFLVENGVVGIQGVDTRAVAVHLRENGEMKGMIVSGDADEALKELKATPSPWEGDMVGGLRTPEAPAPEGAGKHTLVALNLGIKQSLLSQFADLGCTVEILPASASQKDILDAGAEGLILAGGPGNPQTLVQTVDTLKAVLGRMPVLGVGLGHQLLALALGCRVKRMKTGHHGLNCSVMRLADHRGEVTCQHHSFVVDDESLPAGVEVTHVNVNDRTVEGIGSAKHAAASVQFHPGPDDAGKPNRLLTEFVSTL